MMRKAANLPRYRKVKIIQPSVIWSDMMFIDESVAMSNVHPSCGRTI